MQLRYFDFFSDLSDKDLLNAFSQVIFPGIYIGGEIEQKSNNIVELKSTKFVMPHGLIVVETTTREITVPIQQDISNSFTLVATHNTEGSVRNNIVNYEFLFGKLFKEDLVQFDPTKKQFLILAWLDFDSTTSTFTFTYPSKITDSIQVENSHKTKLASDILQQTNFGLPVRETFADEFTGINTRAELVVEENEPALLLTQSPAEYSFYFHFEDKGRALREIYFEATVSFNTVIVIEPLGDLGISEDQMLFRYPELPAFTYKVKPSIKIPESSNINSVFVRFQLKGNSSVVTTVGDELDNRIRIHKVGAIFKRNS